MWEVYADGEEPYKGKSNSEVKTMLTNGIKNPIPKDTPSEGMWFVEPCGGNDERVQVRETQISAA